MQKKKLSKTQVNRALDGVTFSQLLNLHLFTICKDVMLEKYQKTLGEANWTRKRRNEIVHTGRSGQKLDGDNVRKGIESIQKIISHITNQEDA